MLIIHNAGVSVACLENRPVLLDGLDFYYNTYKELKTDRSVGFSSGQIPWSSIIKWCNEYEIHDITDKETVVRYIRAMEHAENNFDQQKETKV